MIEKLENSEQSIYDSNQNFIGTMPTLSSGAILGKINELVDAVNEIMTWRFDCDDESPAENVQDRMIGCTTLNIPESYKTDPYVEQRKWIGKVCRFWDDDDKPENCVYDILCNIFGDPHHEDCPFQCGNGEWYEYCEPVKPDDDIIYKGK